MIVLQILGIPLIAILLLGAVFVIGSSGIEHREQLHGEDQHYVPNDEPDKVQTAASIDFFHRAGNF